MNLRGAPKWLWPTVGFHPQCYRQLASCVHRRMNCAYMCTVANTSFQRRKGSYTQGCVQSHVQEALREKSHSCCALGWMVWVGGGNACLLYASNGMRTRVLGSISFTPAFILPQADDVTALLIAWFPMRFSSAWPLERLRS